MAEHSEVIFKYMGFINLQIYGVSDSRKIPWSEGYKRLPVAILVVSLLSCRAFDGLNKANKSEQGKTTPHPSQKKKKFSLKKCVWHNIFHWKMCYFSPCLWTLSLLGLGISTKRTVGMLGGKRVDCRLRWTNLLSRGTIFSRKTRQTCQSWRAWLTLISIKSKSFY